jgi:raffinose synthase
MQVWNMNKYGGVVGVFNIQGSSWSRSRRQFIIHDNSPPPLTTVVRPADIPLFSNSQAPDAELTSGSNGGQSASSSSSNNGSSSAQEFAVYSNATGDMSVLGLQDEMPISLAGRLAIKRSLFMHAI